MSLESVILKTEGRRRRGLKRFQASIVRYGYGTVYAESKDEAEEKAKHLQADEIKWIKSNGSENMLIYVVELPSADEQS